MDEDDKFWFWFKALFLGFLLFGWLQAVHLEGQVKTLTVEKNILLEACKNDR